MFSNLKKRINKNIFYEHFKQILKNKYFSTKIKCNPFGNFIVGTKNDYLNLYHNSLKIRYPEIENFENLHNFKIDRLWLNELALHTQVTIKESDICFQHGVLLYTSLRKYLANHKIKNTNQKINILETGTARGFSSLCMAKALHDSCADGLIHTIDIIPHNKKFYWNIIDDLEGKKSRSQLLKPWNNLVNKYIKFYEGNSIQMINKLNINRINFCFLDASHTFFDVKKESQKIIKLQDKNDIIFFDDYSANYDGVVKASNYVTNKYNYTNQRIRANQSRGYMISIKN